MIGYRVRPPDATVEVGNFDCGRQPLDDYIRRYASQDVCRDMARASGATFLRSGH